MPTKTKPTTSRVSSRATKKSGFQFRWWMGVLLVAVIAIIGVVIIRFSNAATTRNFYVDNGTIQPGGGTNVMPATNGRTRGYTASANAIAIYNGAFAQSEERFADIVSGYNPANVEKADIQVCFTMYVWAFGTAENPAENPRYSVEILDWGGNQVAVDQGIVYANGTFVRCVRQTVGSPDGGFKFFYKAVGISGNASLYVVTAQRTTLAIYTKNSGGQPGPAPTPGPAPPPQQQQCVNGSTGTVTCGFPAGTLVSTCGYRNINGYALVCPQGNWNYLGTGDVDYNRARQLGATHEHDVGYWQQGNFCGVKSRITSSPRLDFQSANHFYLVGCQEPAAAFKAQAEKNRPKRGGIAITRYGTSAMKSSAPGFGICIFNTQNPSSPFGCSGDNPWPLKELDANQSYTLKFDIPSGWRVKSTTVNGNNGGVECSASNCALRVYVIDRQVAQVGIYLERTQ